MRRAVRYESAGEAIDVPVTKLGGQPLWLRAPQWPVSASLAEPMTFIGQFRLDTGDSATGSGDPATGSGDSAAGGDVRMAYVFMTDSDEHVDGTWEPEGGENAVIIQPDGRIPPFVAVRDVGSGPSRPAEDHLPVDELVTDDEELWDFLGGDPVWLQGDETPGAGWRLVAQLTDGFGLNFGDAGIGYVFVSPDGAEGRFLWQCG